MHRFTDDTLEQMDYELVGWSIPFAGEDETTFVLYNRHTEKTARVVMSVEDLREVLHSIENGDD